MVLKPAYGGTGGGSMDAASIITELDGALDAASTIRQVAYISGRYYPLYGANLSSATSPSVTTANNRCDIVRWVADQDIAFDQLGVYVVTGGGGVSGKIVIYTEDVIGMPGPLLWTSAALDFSVSATFANDTVGLPSFSRATPYWVGVVANGVATTRGVGGGNTASFGFGYLNATDLTHSTSIRRSGASYATPVDPWVFSSAELGSFFSTPLVLGRA